MVSWRKMAKFTEVLDTIKTPFKRCFNSISKTGLDTYRCFKKNVQCFFGNVKRFFKNVQCFFKNNGIYFWMYTLFSTPI